MENVRVEAQVLFALLIDVDDDCLQEPSFDYGGLLDSLDASELLMLMEKVQDRLKYLDFNRVVEEKEPVELYIDKCYVIRMGFLDGPVLQLRPLVKTLFILFLKHPEGILLKQRDSYRPELEQIYAAISPNISKEDIKTRIARLVDLQDNSFSEKASVLNARLEELLPEGIVSNYQIKGYNGHPRKIQLNPLLVHWE